MRPVSPESVIERVAEWFHVEPSDIMSTKQDKYLHRSRGMAVAMLHDVCGRSWTSSMRLIGREYGSGGILGVARAIDPAEAAAVAEFVRAPESPSEPETGERTPSVISERLRHPGGVW